MHLNSIIFLAAHFRFLHLFAAFLFQFHICLFHFFVHCTYAVYAVYTVRYVLHAAYIFFNSC